MRALGLLRFLFTPFALEECGIELSHGILLHPWKDMRVHVHRHADLRVAQQLLVG
jgi:hypothetical protein